MNKLQKEQCVSSVREGLQGQSLVVVVRQQGVTVAEASQLRRDMRKEGAHFKVLKNTLLNIAIAGTEFEELKTFLSGPTALAYSEDPVSAARVVSKFAEGNSEKIQIVGGWMNGKILSIDAVQVLAKLPSMSELRAKLIGLLMAPATKVVRVIKEPMSRVARVMAAKG